MELQLKLKKYTFGPRMTETLGEFFEDSEIFVTGGSGVVGKALIEKLLRSTNVRKIYVLLRPRGQLNAEQRLAKLRDAKVFQVLRAQKPQELNKLIAIPGDVSLPQLGIDPNHLKLLDQVSIVFHCAATVRFDEPLRIALQLNVGGTLEALKFAEQLRHLRIFVHVSTFFSNPYLKRVEPKVFVNSKRCFYLPPPTPSSLQLSSFLFFPFAVVWLAHGLAPMLASAARDQGRQYPGHAHTQVSYKADEEQSFYLSLSSIVVKL